MKFQHSSPPVKGWGIPPVKGWGIMETSEDVPVKIETHQLGDGKRYRQVELVAFNKAPTAFLAMSFEVERKTCDL